MLTVWGMCPYRFKRQYLQKEKFPGGPSMIAGTSFHRAAQVNSKQKVKSFTDLPVDDLKDAARDSWMERAKEGVYIAKDDLPDKPRILKESFNDALRAVELYREEVAPRVLPVFAEEKFQESFGFEIPVVFVVDYIDADGKIGDWKTSGKKPQEGEARNSLQGVFYAMGYEQHFGKPPADFEQYWLVTRRGKTGNPTTSDWFHQSYLPTQADYRGLQARIADFLQALRLGLFPPSYRGAWWCTDGFCEYFQTCKYVGNEEPARMI
jgi:hypothetical protein